MTKKIAFLGMGVMGAPMSLNLQKKGYQVTVWNRAAASPHLARVAAAGLSVAPAIATAVQDADYIFSCVSDVPDVKSVLLGEEGVIHDAKPNALIIDFSTIGKPAAQEIAKNPQNKKSPVPRCPHQWRRCWRRKWHLDDYGRRRSPGF
nr:NAD(P)-binding domain-containing protein [Picosynechococcus sp. NKBG042902]